MKSIVIAVAMAAMFATSDRALAAEAPMMTVDFVGEWCLDHLDGIDQDKNVTWYKSPSWTEGQCKGILLDHQIRLPQPEHELRSAEDQAEGGPRPLRH